MRGHLPTSGASDCASVQAGKANLLKRLREGFGMRVAPTPGMSSTHLAERASAARVARPAGASRPGVRQQILEAALTEFAEKGFQEASLAAIARRLGVTAPLVLYHFGSKANLWREALEVFCSNLGAVVARAAE